MTASVGDSFFVNIEACIGVSTQGFFKSSKSVGSQLGAMDSTGVHFLGSRPPDYGTKRNDRRLLGIRASRFQSSIKSRNVFGVGTILTEPIDALNMPSVRGVARQNVLAEGNISVAFNRDTVVIPQNNEVAKLLRTCERRSLRRNTFLEATITSDDVDLVIENGLAIWSCGIQQTVGEPFCHCETNSRGNTRSQRAGGQFDAWSVAVLGVAGGESTLCA